MRGPWGLLGGVRVREGIGEDDWIMGEVWTIVEVFDCDTIEGPAG